MRNIFKKITAVLIFIFMFCTLSCAAVFAEDGGEGNGVLEITAHSAILVEKETGKVLYEKNVDEKLAPASVTKIMTMLLIAEALDGGKIKIDDMVTCSAYAASMGGSQVYLKEGERMTVKDMLKAITVSSGNDASVAMAEFVSGSAAEFVDEMNKRAAELGMKNTNFVNCTGLDSEGHLTTAADISLMSRELLKHEMIKEYTTIWMDTIRNGEFGLSNTNKLIRFYDGATGLKTGSTGNAKYCMSATAEQNGMELIAVVMAAPSSSERFEDAKTLLNYGFAKYSLYKDEKEQLLPIKVLKGKQGNVQPVINDSTSLVIEKGSADKIEKTITLAENLQAPVEKGQKLGEITLSLEGKVVAVIDITAMAEVQKAGLLDIALKVFRCFLTL